MTIYQSPKLVMDGLVFCCDMGNTAKSWLGKPSTNYINTTPTWSGDGTNQTSFVKQSVEVTQTFLQYRGLKTFLWSPGSSLNCYLQSDDIVGGTGTTSATWTFSCYIRREDKLPITSMSVYMYFPTSDGAAAGTIVDVGDGWYRIYRTRTGTASYISLAGFTGMMANTRYYLSGAMLTMDDAPVGPLDGNATRSSSQALLDLTRNETITINGSPTYNSNSITIPNVNTAYLDVTPMTNFRMGTSNFTLSCWIKQLDNGTNVILESRDSSLLGYMWVLNYPGTGQISILLNYNTSQQLYQSTLSTLSYGSVQHITTVVDRTNTSVKHYVNGVLWDTVTGVHANSITGSTGEIYRLGYDRGGSTQNYELYSFSHYSRALTASEVQQNFNALRGRYGI